MNAAIPPPDFGNYLETSNPFGLSRPPAFFLREMAGQDADLVLFPSMQECVYRLCRRVKFGPPPCVTLATGERKPDTKFMATHRLMGVTGIVPFPHWGIVLLQDLVRMDTWRMGTGGAAESGDNLADALDRLEEEKRDRQDALTMDESDQRGISAWHARQLRQGSTVGLGNGPRHRTVNTQRAAR